MQEQTINLHWKQKRKEAIEPRVRTVRGRHRGGAIAGLFIQCDSVNLALRMTLSASVILFIEKR